MSERAMIGVLSAMPQPEDDREGLQAKAESIRSIFIILWPMALAIFGVLLIVAFIAIPDLRQPAYIASLSGLFTVVSTIGLAQRGSR